MSQIAQLFFEGQTHLKQSEAESILIIREAVAEFRNSVMLNLARKAFYRGTSST